MDRSIRVARYGAGWLAAVAVLVCANTAASQPVVVEGNVRWADGIPAPGVAVTLTTYKATAVTDAAGHYRFENVPPGVWGFFEASYGGNVVGKAVSLITLKVETVDITLSAASPRVHTAAPGAAPDAGSRPSPIAGATSAAVPTQVSASAPPRPGPPADDVVEGASTVVLADGVATVEERVVVTAPLPMLSTSTDAGRLRLEPEQVEALPSLGARDIFRALQLLPGVSSNETSSGLFVRGGTPDQTLVAYDGTTVFSVDHLFGYFSAFNMDAVDSVELSKGSYDARQGGRLSSLTEITSKSRAARRQGTLGASLLNVDGAFGFPVGSKISGMVAARQSFQTPLYNRILGLVNTTTTPRPPAGGGPAGGPGGPPGGFAGSFSSEPKSNFNDFNLRLDATPRARDGVVLSLYQGRDTVDNSRDLQLPSELLSNLRNRGLEVPDDLSIKDARRFSNLAGSVAWRHEWSTMARSALTVSRSTFDSDTERSANGGGRQGSTGESNFVGDWTVRLDTPIQFSPFQELSVGVQYTKQRARYALQNAQGPPSGFTGNVTSLSSSLNRDNAGDMVSAYAQHRLFLGSRFIATPGVRATRFSTTGETNVEPRLSATAILTNQLRLKGAWGIYHQYVNRLVREDVLQGNREFWALADGTSIPTSRSVNAAAGATYETATFLVDVEAYSRRMSGLSQLVPRVLGSSGGVDLAGYFYNGSGTARGLETLIQRKLGRHTGWASYTWSRVLYDFPTLGQPFLADHNRTHELKLVDTATLGPWSVSGTWIYSSGRPYTEPAGTTAFTVDTPFGERVFERIDVGEKNGVQLPAYHRLDLAANYGWTFGDGRRAIAGVSVFNGYNRRNVWYREFSVVDGKILQNDINLMRLTLNALITLKF